MYIQPNTIVKILKGCPLDTTYEHTIYFPDKVSQFDYFNNLVKYTLPDLYYQRVNKNQLKVQLCADNIYDCNYIMFQNTSYSNRWFYAFITSVEYISNKVAQITYVLDIMQTWYFDYQLKQCFVEREHVTNDSIGANTIPEDLELGGYVTTQSKTYGSGELTVSIMCTGIPPEIRTKFGDDWYKENCKMPSKKSGILNPTYEILLDNTLAGGIKLCDIVNIFNADVEGNEIVCIYTFDKELCQSNFAYSTEVATKEFSFYSPKINLRTDGKPVKNNKLYVYPYYTIVVHACGKSVELRSELFTNTPSFLSLGARTPNATALFIPTNYAGYDIDYSKAISLTGFPLLAWVYDGYQQYIAEHGATLRATGQNISDTRFGNIINSVIGAVGAGISGDVSGITSVLRNTATSIINDNNNVRSLMAKKQDIKAISDTANGNVSNTDILASGKRNMVYAYGRAIRSEYATAIDDYFTKYGYAINRLKVPNIHARKHWTYTKTVGATIVGSVPADTMKSICAIYDNGITFWTADSTIGDYSVNNPTL